MEIIKSMDLTSQPDHQNKPEYSTWEGRCLLVRWDGSPLPPPRELVTQASGICFTNDGQIVLVAGENNAWGLPGGHPEPGESIEQALIREVWEEACATIEHFVYIGSQIVEDPETPDAMKTYYQTRFWARVRLEPFKPLHEITRRTTTPAENVLALLQWHSTPLGAHAMLRAAIEQEQSFRKSKTGL